jgi:hypothetical protein
MVQKTGSLRWNKRSLDDCADALSKRLGSSWRQTSVPEGNLGKNIFLRQAANDIRLGLLYGIY